MTIRFNVLISLAALLLGATFARAQHRGDILLDLTTGQIRTNQFDLDGSLFPDIRVFRATLGTAAPNFTDSPGFDSNPGTFPYPSSNGFRILKALRIWNGTAFVRLPPAPPTLETIEITFATLGPVISPPCDSPVQGFTLSVGSNGEWHRHLEYTLAEPGTPGIYLLEMQVFSNQPSVGQTRPFWLVILQPQTAGSATPAETASQDAAVQWVIDHRVPQLCPADFNASGVFNVADIFAYLSAWFAHDFDADFNGDCSVTVADIFAFLTAWFAGCPG